MKKIIQALIVAGMLIVPALSYLDDYHDPNDHSKYHDHGWIMEQHRLWNQMQMDALEKEEIQTQTSENRENIMNELRGTEVESQDSYDPVCPDFGCG